MFEWGLGGRNAYFTINLVKKTDKEARKWWPVAELIDSIKQLLHSCPTIRGKKEGS